MTRAAGDGRHATAARPARTAATVPARRSSRSGTSSSTSPSRAASCGATSVTSTPSTTSASTSATARCSAWSANPAAASPPSAGRSSGSCRPPPASASIDGEDIFTKRGADLKRLRRRMQIIFQDPVGSLNPRMPVSDIIGEGLAGPGGRREPLGQAQRPRPARRRLPRVRRAAPRLRAPLSARVLAAASASASASPARSPWGPTSSSATSPSPRSTSPIQSQILNLLLDLRREFGLTYLFIAHNLSVVQYISDRVAVMYLGKIVEIGAGRRPLRGSAAPVLDRAALRGARAGPAPPRAAHRAQGRRARPADPPSGCRFRHALLASRAARRPEVCATNEPPFRDIGGGHLALPFLRGGRRPRPLAWPRPRARRSPDPRSLGQRGAWRSSVPAQGSREAASAGVMKWHAPRSVPSRESGPPGAGSSCSHDSPACRDGAAASSAGGTGSPTGD